MSKWHLRRTASRLVNALVVVTLLLPGEAPPPVSATGAAGSDVVSIVRSSDSAARSTLAPAAPPDLIPSVPVPSYGQLPEVTPAREQVQAGPPTPARVVTGRKDVGRDGGSIDIDPDVTLDIPSDATDEPFKLTMGTSEHGFRVRGDILKAFSLQAEGKQSGKQIRKFRKELTLKVKHDLTGIDLAQQSLQIHYWDEEGLFWAPIPTEIDQHTGVLTTKTDHFTDFCVMTTQGGAVVWPQYSDVNNYSTDLYGSSATFRYPFELPNGPGGFKPQLNITGSSAEAYAKRRSKLRAEQSGWPGAQEAGWVGLGFELDIPYIEAHKVTLTDNSQVTRYSLFFGGSSQKLIDTGALEPGLCGYDAHVFRTETEQFWRVMSCGDYWYLVTTDGTRYVFGVGYDAGVPHPNGKGYEGPKLNYVAWDQNINPYDVPFIWYASKIQDPSGNVAIIGYDFFQDTWKDGSPRDTALASEAPDPEVDGCNGHPRSFKQAVYPVVITYGFVSQYGGGTSPASNATPLVRVYFNRTSWQRLDFTGIADSKLRADRCVQAFYDSRALDSIDVKVLNNGSESLVRRYQLSYENNGQGIPLLLTGIQEIAGGQWLPAVSLNWPVYSDNPEGLPYAGFRLFDRVSNGYNGTVSYTYAFTLADPSYKDRWGLINPYDTTASVARVTSRTAQSGATGGSPAITQTYAYPDGPPKGNNDSREPEYRGYATVVATESGKTIEHYFLQGLGGTKTLSDGTSFVDSPLMKGREWKTVTKQGSTTLEIIESLYEAQTVDYNAGLGYRADSSFIKVSTRMISRYPGPKRVKYTYQYDVHGNVTQEIVYDASASPSVALRRVDRDYIKNLDRLGWTVDRIFNEKVYDGSGQQVSSTATYYDADYLGSTSPPSESTPAIPTRGLPTMVRQAKAAEALDPLTGRCLDCVRTYFAYDDYGNRTSSTDANGNTTTTQYDARQTFPATMTFPIVGSASATWDAGLGKPLTSTDINRQTTTFEYDPFGRLKKIVRPGDSSSLPTTAYQYLDGPSVTGATDHSVTTTQRVDATTTRTKIEFFDGFNRSIEAKVLNEDGLYMATFRGYDANGRLLYESVPVNRTSSAVETQDRSTLVGVKTVYGYDAADRATSVQSPASGTMSFYYPDGWTTLAVDANLHCRSTSVDALGRTKQVSTFDGTYNSGTGSCGTEARRTLYTYDGASRLTRVDDGASNASAAGTDPAQIRIVTSISYDWLGRKTSMTDPDLGHWTYDQHDDNGNLLQQTDARGQVVYFEYDALNRPIEKSAMNAGQSSGSFVQVRAADVNDLRTEINAQRAANGLGQHTWTSPAGDVTADGTASARITAATFQEMRDALVGLPGFQTGPQFTAGEPSVSRTIRLSDITDLNDWVRPTTLQTITYTYDQGANGKGRRTGLIDVVGSTTYTYDARGRELTEARTQGSQTYVTAFEYNSADEQTAITYPDSTHERVATAYNARGLPRQLTTNASSGTYQGAYIWQATYDALGRATDVRHTSDTSRASAFAYDAATTRLSSFSAPSVQRSYGYDAVGNLTCLNPSSTSACNPLGSGVQGFAYDASDQLTEVKVAGTTTIASYQYDVLGNLRQKTEGSTSTTLDYLFTGRPLLAHTPSSVTTDGTTLDYSYDHNGNLRLRGAEGFSYDGENRLSQVTQSGGTVRYRYDGDGRLVQRIGSDGTVDYVGEIYQKNVATGEETKRYYFGSALVATRVDSVVSDVYQDYLHSVVGSGTATAEYYPFGLVRGSTGSLPTDRRFTGQKLEPTGLYQMGARFYDPTIGRFIQPDSIVPNPANAKDLNRYSYVHNNPLKLIDPSGHAVVLPQCAPGFCDSVWIDLDTVASGDPNAKSAAGALAQGICLFAGCHYDSESGEVRGPTVEEYRESAASGATLPMPAAMGVAPLGKTLSIASQQTIQRYGIMPYGRFGRATAKGYDAAHHLVEKRFWRQLGFSSEAEAEKNILAVGVDEATYAPIGKGQATITDRIRDTINYRTGTHRASLQDIWEAHRDVYRGIGRDDWAELIWDAYFKDAPGIVK